MELEVFQINGKKTSKKVKLNDSIFGIEPNDHAIYLDTKQYMAHQRQGTSSVQERNAVTGSTRKIKRQKGTGTARAGSIKSPIFRGGGRVFGPEPRMYYFKLNKKVKRLARKSALSYKVKDKEMMILEDFSFETPKTKNFREIITAFDIADKKAMFVFSKTDPNVILSSRNIKGIKVVNASELNTYDILNHSKLFLVESSLKEIEAMFTDRKNG